MRQKLILIFSFIVILFLAGKCDMALSYVPPAASLQQIDLFISGTEGYNTFRIPAVIVSPKGTILTFCEGRKFSTSDAGEIDLVLKRSIDGGKTWLPLQVVVTEKNMTCGNPAPVIDRDTGIIWLLITKNPADKPEDDIIKGIGSRTVWVTKSADDGATWSTPREITNDTKKPSWTWYATGPCHGIQLKNGRLVIPCDFVEGKTNNYAEFGFAHVIYSDDHGKTWRIGGIAQKGTNESAAVQTVDGALYLNARAYRGTGTRLYAWSYDNGENFSNFGQDSTLIESVCQGSVIRFTEAPFDSKNRILFSNPASRNSRDHLRIRLSYDECKTWQVSKLLNESPSAYSDMAVTPDKAILCLYERGFKSAYEKITLAQFNLEWLTDNADHLRTLP